MESIFKELLDLDDVDGVMLFSFEGDLILREFSSPSSGQLEDRHWWSLFIGSLKGIREAELVFERKRVYVRAADSGYLFIITGEFAPMAMMRLSCDLILPRIRTMGRPKGLKRFFVRKG